MMRYRKILVFMCTITASHIALATPCQLEIAKEATRAYYEDGEYDRDLTCIRSTVQAQFSQPAAHDKQVVIFDVDDVSLSTYPFFKDHDFGCVWETWCDFLLKHNLPAIEPMRELFNHFKRLGYKTIFLTSRLSTFHEVTTRNLLAVGYADFERLITRDVSQAHVKGAHFKEQTRKGLATEGYEIVCCIDDAASNLTGEHLGHAIKVPNRLYS